MAGAAPELPARDIAFGTDGWRGLIARDFTFANLRRAADAFARAIGPKSRVVIGFDHRFLSQEFAAAAASAIAARGHRAIVASVPTSSPALSYSLAQFKAQAGIMITASHNPAGYNGFKIKVRPGRSADQQFTSRVEALVESAADLPSTNGAHESFDPHPAYLDHLISRLDKSLWKRARAAVAVDAMHGTGGPLWKAIFARLGFSGRFVRMSRDPLFGGTAPEPIEKNLAPLAAELGRGKALAGLAADGDADRLGVLDEHGAYVPPHWVFPAILWHLVENRKLRGAVIQAVSLGYISERMAKEYKLPFAEVPVGFKFVADAMARRKVLWGGEESGGYGVGLWSQERDGILSGLLLVECLLAAGKPLSVLRQELARRFGESHFQRIDFSLRQTVPDKAVWAAAITKKIPDKLLGQAVRNVRTTDGLKVILGDDSWVLLRPSGTESLLRTYAESPTLDSTKRLLAKAQEWAGAKALVQP